MLLAWPPTPNTAEETPVINPDTNPAENPVGFQNTNPDTNPAENYTHTHTHTPSKVVSIGTPKFETVLEYFKTTFKQNEDAADALAHQFFTQVQSTDWLDGKGQKIGNWKKYANSWHHNQPPLIPGETHQQPPKQRITRKPAPNGRAGAEIDAILAGRAAAANLAEAGQA